MTRRRTIEIPGIAPVREGNPMSLVAAALLLVAPAIADASRLGAFVEVEGGPAWQSRNDVQIPAETGTRFSLRDLGSGPVLAYRAYVGVRLDHHELRGLWAPLTVDLATRRSGSRKMAAPRAAPTPRWKADNGGGDVYSFPWLHYGVAGIAIRL